MKRKLILITGGSASGKTTIAEQLKERFGNDATLISQDSFYHKKGDASKNYDIPSAFDFELQNEVITSLLEGKETKVPKYNFAKHRREGQRNVDPGKYIILEGLFSFYDKKTFNASIFKIFVDTPSDTRLARRVLRDTKERGREVAMIIERWLDTVQPSYEKYIRGQRRKADIIIPWSQVKEKAIESMVATFTTLKDN